MQNLNIFLDKFFLLLYFFYKIIVQLKFQRPPARELLKHPFIRRAKKNNILIELIERTTEYKSRLGPSSDSDADDDGDSSQGNDSWEYPTIRNNLNNDDNGVVDDENATVRVTATHIRPSIKPAHHKKNSNEDEGDISPNDTIVNHGANPKVAAIAHQLKSSMLR